MVLIPISRQALRKKKGTGLCCRRQSQSRLSTVGKSLIIRRLVGRRLFSSDRFIPTKQAGIKLVNIKTGEVVFAYAVNKKNSLHGRQTAAEACAKHMNEVVAH